MTPDPPRSEPRDVPAPELADHAARLEAIVNLVSDAVLVVGGDGRLTFVNAVGQRLLGLAPGTALDARHRRLDVRTPDGAPLDAARAPSARALAGETLTGLDLELTGAAGDRRRVVAAAHPLRRPDGTVYAAVVTLDDVTDEVRVREAVDAAREAAEEASRLKDQFIAALSHELRAPLQPILGWAEVLRRHAHLDDVTSRAIEAIRRNIRQQVRLVDDLLDLSRVVHRKLVLRYETVDLREQVRAAAEPYEEIAALKHVRLEMRLPREPVLVWGDGSRIQQIAANLISNGVKFTPPGGRVGVRLTAGDGHALLEVEDTGEGIAPEDLGMIFDAFGQAGRGERRGGLGIGLDLVRRLTELHGGQVEASSPGPGQGSRFRVRLPLGQPGQAPAAAPAAPRRRLDRRSVLVIEDNDDTREVMKFMLELEGAHVETADAGDVGLQAALAGKPEIILCDIGLPDIDGLEVARRLRRELPGAAPMLIALTGYGQAEDVRQAMEAGFQAHLTKPVNLDELLRLLG